MDHLIEYRVRPVTRYIVTRFEDRNAADPKPHNVACAKQIGGEHASEDAAYQVAYACCKVEHERLGWPLDDDRIQYPKPIEAAEQIVTA